MMKSNFWEIEESFKKQLSIIYPLKNTSQKKQQDKSPSTKKLTFGQRAADALTKMAGSWGFIILFILFILFWMFLNIHITLNWKNPTFDPYPFILLNLVLSCLAALQAPIILMSQNRSAERDRIRAEYDYAVNRKAEKEIRDIREALAKIKYALKIK